MQVLIAPKPIAEFEPEEYHSFISGMYELRHKGKAVAPKPAEGLTLIRTKSGVLSVRRTKAKRPFPYVLRSELTALAKEGGFSETEVWNAFRERKFLIAETEAEAMEHFKELGDIPW